MIISQALFSGAAVACTAKVEFNGIPVNNKLLERIDGSFPLLKNKIIDADDDAPIYKLDVPQAQVMRNETRKMHLASAKGELDLADKGIIHSDLLDRLGNDREEHITYNPNTNQMKFVDVLGDFDENNK